MDWPVCLIGLGLSPGRNDETPLPIGSICFKPVHVYLARSNPSSTALHPYLGHQLQTGIAHTRRNAEGIHIPHDECYLKPRSTGGMIKVMLVLTRKAKQSIMIGDGIEITVVEIKGDAVKLAIDAPRDVPVHRREVYEEIQRENREASSASVEDVSAIDKLLGGRP
jgi:carbon storage regulator